MTVEFPLHVALAINPDPERLEEPSPKGQWNPSSDLHSLPLDLKDWDYGLASVQKSAVYLFLRKKNHDCIWYYTDPSFQTEIETGYLAKSPSVAIAKARIFWKKAEFHLLHCGFCYSLPERDEVGMNAFFKQMAESYGSLNGYYYDKEFEHLCFVDLASQEALEVWRKLRCSK